MLKDILRILGLALIVVSLNSCSKSDDAMSEALLKLAESQKTDPESQDDQEGVYEVEFTLTGATANTHINIYMSAQSKVGNVSQIYDGTGNLVGEISIPNDDNLNSKYSYWDLDYFSKSGTNPNGTYKWKTNKECISITLNFVVLRKGENTPLLSWKIFKSGKLISNDSKLFQENGSVFFMIYGSTIDYLNIK